MMTELIKNLRSDSELYYAWQSAIAMNFIDEAKRNGISGPDLHYTANQAAKNFLNMLIAPINSKDLKSDISPRKDINV